MATYEDTNRSGRKIGTMRSLGRGAMDNSPWVSTWPAKKKNEPWRTSAAARHVGSVVLVFASAEKDRTDGKKTN